MSYIIFCVFRLSLKGAKKMKTAKQVLACMAVVSLLVASQTGAMEFEWAVIGDAGNEFDTNSDPERYGYGSVNYEYRISKFEVTNAQYIEFLNAVGAAPDGSDGLYVPSSLHPTYLGIVYDGTFKLQTHTEDNQNTGYYFYENKPVTHVTFCDALRFVNWLNSGNTENGAYMFVNGNLVPDYYNGALRNPSATYWLPSEDEWYKAAYYDPATEEYYEYPTGSNTAPVSEAPPGATNGGENSANYKDGVHAVTTDPPLTDVGAYYNADSPYGTSDQGGSLWEWNEAILTGQYRVLRGGSFNGSASHMSATWRDGDYFLSEGPSVGFRIASEYDIDGETAIPEPLSLILTGFSAFGLFVRKMSSQGRCPRE